MSLGLVGRVGELDAAGLHPPAGQDLGLDDRRRAELLGDLPGLCRGLGEAVTRHRDPGFRDDLAGFELKEPHGARKPSGRVVSTLRTVLRPLLIALLALALAPAAASAAVIDIAVDARGRRRFSASPTTVTGKLTGPYGAPAGGPLGRARGAPLPVQAAASTRRSRPPTSGLDGRFAFEHAFDRNQRVRVPAPEFPATAASSSPVYVFPRSALTFGLVRRNVIRLVQTYRTPEGRQAHRPDAVLRRQERASSASRWPPRSRPSRSAPRPSRARRARSRRAASAPPRSCASRGAWKGQLPLRELLPVQRGHGQPEAGLPEEALQVLDRPREAGRRAPTSASARSASRRRVRAGAARARRPGSWAATMTSQP